MGRGLLLAALLCFLLFPQQNSEAWPSKKKVICTTALITATLVGGGSYLWFYQPKVDPRENGLYKPVDKFPIAPENRFSLIRNSEPAFFKIKDGANQTPQLKLLSHDWKQKMVARIINQSLIDREKDEMIKAKLHRGDELLISFNGMSFRLHDKDQVKLYMHGQVYSTPFPEPISIKELESGKIFTLSYPQNHETKQGKAEGEFTISFSYESSTQTLHIYQMSCKITVEAPALALKVEDAGIIEKVVGYRQDSDEFDDQ